MDNQFDLLVRFYEEIMGWPMDIDRNNQILSIRYQGDTAQWVFVASSDSNSETITVFARVPETCPSHCFNTMSEFLERSNFGMTHGAWVMDRNDGEIRYRVGVDVGKLEINDAFLESMTLYTNLTMGYYLEAILSIIKNGISAQEAFNMVFPED
jgi:hypothetical protein